MLISYIISGEREKKKKEEKHWKKGWYFNAKIWVMKLKE